MKKTLHIIEDELKWIDKCEAYGVQITYDGFRNCLKRISKNLSTSHSTDYEVNKKWVAVDDEVKKALSLYKHLKEHPQVKKSPFHKGEPICKICGLSATQIKSMEWEKIEQQDPEARR